MATHCSLPQFLSWNCNGLYEHYEDLLLLLNLFSPIALCLQGTHLKSSHSLYHKKYSIFHQEVVSHDIAAGGIALLVSKAVFTESVHLSTKLQVVAVKLYLQTVITVASIYLPPNDIMRREG